MFISAISLVATISISATPLPGGFIGTPSDDGRYLFNTVSTDSGGIDCAAVFDTQTLERVEFCELGLSGPARGMSFDGRRLAVGNVVADPEGTVIRSFDPDREVREPVVQTRVSGDGSTVLIRYGDDVSVSSRQVSFDRLAVTSLDGGEIVTVLDERDRDPGFFGLVDGLINADGSVIAFQTPSSLVPEDGNNLNDIYVFNRNEGAYQLVTAVADSGNAPPDGDSWLAGLSADGRFVLFGTTSDLSLFVNPGASALYRKDLLTGALDLIHSEPFSDSVTGVLSRSGLEVLVTDLGPGDQDLESLFIARPDASNVDLVSFQEGISIAGLQWSPDARFAAFEIYRPGANQTEVFVYDSATATSRLIAELDAPLFTANAALSASTIDVRDRCGDEGQLTLCRVDLNAEFSQGSEITLNLEEPAEGSVYTGVGNLRGWAVGKPDISIRASINGVDIGPVPYGGSRADVGDAFPDDPNGEVSGFSQAFNYNLLPPGQHTMTIEARDATGSVTATSNTFTALSFGVEFLDENTVIETGDVIVTDAGGDDIELSRISLDGQQYSVRLRWSTATQSFEVVNIEPD